MATEADELHSPDSDEEGGPVKPFLDHLEDLRWVLIKSGTALILGMGICMGGARYLATILKWPLIRSGTGVSLEFFGPLAGMMSAMKFSFWGGIILSLPFILYFVAEFVLPALKKTEKRYFTLAFVVGAGLFIGGVLLCYFLVLPLSLKGMAGLNAWLGFPAEKWRAEEYFQFVVALMLGMGLSFEIPVLLLTLVRIGILPHNWLVRGRRYILFANVVACAFITPDALSTIFLVVPTQVLMEVCIWISKGWEKQRLLEESQMAAQEPRYTD